MASTNPIPSERTSGTTAPPPSTNSLPSNTNATTTTSNSTDNNSGSSALNSDPTYPEQHHAGKVGYGPNYRAGPSLEEKIAGFKDELKGKLTHNPGLVEHGRSLKSGEEHRKKLTGEDEPNPFATADEDKKEDGTDKDAGNSAAHNSDTAPAGHAPAGGKSVSTAHPDAPVTQTRPGGAASAGERAAKEQAATVAPEGTHAAEKQRQGRAQDDMRHIDARN